MSSLKDHVVLVVGGSSGLGFGAAKAAQREGARVILASSNESRIAAAVERLGGAKANVSGGTIDVNSEAGVRTFFEQHGAVDHVVYTAGDNELMSTKQFPNLNLDESRSMFDVRYWGVLNLAKIAPQYVRHSITVTGGAAAIRPFPKWSALAPIVGVLSSLVRALALDIAPLRVNLVVPGVIDTEIWDPMEVDARKEFLAAHAGKLPVKHVADADEAAEAYLFAMKCKYFTGQEIVIDGGGTLV